MKIKEHLKSGLPFNLYSIIGGQLENDKEHKLYMLYPSRATGLR